MGFSLGKALGTIGLGGNAIGALSLGADIISANSQNAKAKRAATTAWNRQQSWDEYKLRNAHQIEKEDLLKAGMNPAYTTRTDGAQSGTLSATPASVTGYGQIGQNAMNNLTSLATLDQRQQEIDSQIKLNNAYIDSIREQTKWLEPKAKQEIKESGSRIVKNNAETMETKAREALTTAQIAETGQQTIALELQNAINKVEVEIRTGNYGKALAYIDRTLETVKNGGQAFSYMVGPLMAMKALGPTKEFATQFTKFMKSPGGQLIKNYNPSRYPGRY